MTMARSNAFHPTDARPRMPAISPILIMAIGNPSRGDDAIGPVLLDAFAQWLAQQTPAIQDRIELLQEQQLMVEHVADLTQRHRILIVDAAAQSALQAIALQTVATDASRPLMPGHQMSPAHLLSWYQHLQQSSPPPCQTLTIRGEQFELGAPLSPAVLAIQNEALQTLIDWAQQAVNNCHA